MSDCRRRRGGGLWLSGGDSQLFFYLPFDACLRLCLSLCQLIVKLLRAAASSFNTDQLGRRKTGENRTVPHPPALLLPAG